MSVPVFYANGNPNDSRPPLRTNGVRTNSARLPLHVVQFSGGIGSACAALSVARRHGTDRLVLLIADVLQEDPDLWRFSEAIAHHLGVRLTIVCDGRTPWEVFADKRWLGNARVAHCSVEIKVIPCLQWLEINADPATTILYIGLDANKRDAARAPAIVDGWAPWTVEFPLLQEAPRAKRELLQEVADLGIAPPRLYELGFEHNNCAGMCVRAGARQWRLLHDVFPQRFATALREEQKLRGELGDVAMLRYQRDNVKHPLPLAMLAARIYDEWTGDAALSPGVPPREPVDEGGQESIPWTDLATDAATLERYHGAIHRRGHDECWYWVAGLTKQGQGIVRAGSWATGSSHAVPAHLLGWSVAHGAPPEGDVTQSCGEPSCQQPRHWTAGTSTANAPFDVRGPRGRAVAIRDAIVHARVTNPGRIEEAIAATLTAGDPPAQLDLF